MNPTFCEPGSARQVRRTIVVAALWVASSLPGIASLASEPADLSFEPFRLETRAEGEIEAELGRFRVPENRSRTDSRRLEIAFVRLSRAADAVGPPIVYLAGGPGGSGIQAGEGSRFALFDALRASGDVILLDQRGVGRSTPIDPEECSEAAVYPPDRPLELEPYLALVEEVAAACARFWRSQGIDLAGFNTLESVADLETLRRALDAEQLDLLGISYGSHLALAYMRQHPDRVRRAVLAGVEGPDHTVKLPAQFEAQLDKLQVVLDANPSTGPVEIRPLIRRVLEELERRPVTLRIVTLEGPDSETRLRIGRRDVAAVTLNLLQDPGAMIQLPRIYQRLAQGDFTDIAGALLDQRRIGRLDAMPEAMDAASGISPDRLRRLEEQDSETLLGSGILLANVATARGLAVPDLGSAFRAPLASDTPTLFISGELDGRTPPSNAREVMTGFSRAQHLVVRNGGHSNDLLVAPPGIEGAIVDFFLGRDSPGRDSLGRDSLGHQPEDSQLAVPPPDPSKGSVRMALTPEQARAYVGEYERREREIWRILHHQTVETLSPGGEVLHANAVLQIRWAGDGFPFQPVSEQVFYIDFPWFLGQDFRFEIDDSGRVTHLLFEDGEGRPVRAPKVH